jgi:hypothetical protein
MLSDSDPTVKPAGQILPEPSLLFRHDTEWNVAICTRCEYAVAAKTLQRHARESHQISHYDYKSSVNALQTKSLPNTYAEFPI